MTGFCQPPQLIGGADLSCADSGRALPCTRQPPLKKGAGHPKSMQYFKAPIFVGRRLKRSGVGDNFI